MREFVFGSDRQFELLEQTLEDQLCHVYNNCSLPTCCSKPSGRIGFEKEGDTYAIFIDLDITCSNRKAPSLFRDWLVSGTLRFLDFPDIKEFFRSLKCLYD